MGGIKDGSAAMSRIAETDEGFEGGGHEYPQSRRWSASSLRFPSGEVDTSVALVEVLNGERRSSRHLVTLFLGVFQHILLSQDRSDHHPQLV